MRQKRILATVVCLLAIAMTGCGFHPRAELVVPPDLGPVRIVTKDPYSAIGVSLSRALTRAGAQGPAVGEAKVATLRIDSETFSVVPLTVDAFARVTEYNVIYTVKFAFVDPDGVDILPLQSVELQRDFQFDVTHALGIAGEENTMHDEMQRDIAGTILRRIGIALRHYKS